MKINNIIIGKKYRTKEATSYFVKKSAIVKVLSICGRQAYVQDLSRNKYLGGQWYVSLKNLEELTLPLKKPFKSGDLVRCNTRNRYSKTTPDVVCRVIEVHGTPEPLLDDIKVQIIEGEHAGKIYNVESRFFKLEEPPTLEVTQDGSTITVKLTENGNVTEASAKCSPTDTFDYLTGVQIALTRLAQKTGKPPKIYLPKDTTAYQVELL